VAENGGHRLQRVPPTERRGRVHTSTVTVAVIDADDAAAGRDVRDSDLVVSWFSGSGAGGQHRNKHQNCCRVTHVPTGVTRAAQGRERSKNLREATESVRLAIALIRDTEQTDRVSVTRRHAVGSGMRGDKTTTIRFQADEAKCHATGKTIKASRYMKGYMNELW